MTVIRQDHLIESIADALQYISYYHPLDYIKALGAAYQQDKLSWRAAKAASRALLPFAVFKPKLSNSSVLSL